MWPLILSESWWNLISFPLTPSWDFCCCMGYGSSHTELTVVSRKWVVQVIFVFSLKFTQKKKKKHKFGRNMMYILSFIMLWHDPNGTPKILATSRTVILLFPKTRFFPQSAIASVFWSVGVPSNQHLWQTSYHFGTWKITQKLVFCPLSPLQKLVPTF